MAKASSTQQVNEQWLSQACPFSVTLSALGHRWRAPILWKLLRGDRTFADLTRSLPLVTEKMLAQELKRLQGLGLVAKQGVARQPLRKLAFMQLLPQHQINLVVFGHGHGLLHACIVRTVLMFCQ